MSVSEEKILPIDTNTIMHGYSHNASVFSIAAPRVGFNGYDGIIGSLSFTDNEIMTDECICGENTDLFSTTKVEVICDGEKKYIKTGYSADGNYKGGCFLYRNVSGNISCKAEICEFKWNNIWSFSGIRIAKDTDKYEAEFRVGFVANNMIACIHVYDDHSKDEYKRFDNTEGYKYVSAEISNGKIISRFSIDGENWVEYSVEDNYIFSDKPIRIGYCLWPDEDRFKNWFYTNYIQLHSSDDLWQKYDVSLDYYCGTNCFERYDIFNPWIVQNYVDMRILGENDIIGFIIRCIDNDFYPCVMLNEKYIPGKWAFCFRDFDHENMVYGYNRSKNLLYLMGFNKEQKFVPFSLSFDVFEQAYKTLLTHHEIRLMKFEVQMHIYELNPVVITRVFTEYLNSTDSSYREDLRINQSSRIFGISIYDAILNNAERLSDKRIAYSIYEHKKIMTLRMDYFHLRGLFSDKDYEELHSMATALENESNKLLFMCIKYKISSSETVLEKIRQKVEQIKQNDIVFTKRVIELLKKAIPE